MSARVGQVVERKHPDQFFIPGHPGAGISLFISGFSLVTLKESFILIQFIKYCTMSLFYVAKEINEERLYEFHQDKTMSTPYCLYIWPT